MIAVTLKQVVRQDKFKNSSINSNLTEIHRFFNNFQSLAEETFVGDSATLMNNCWR